jgi:hypothetical protein
MVLQAVVLVLEASPPDPRQCTALIMAAALELVAALPEAVPVIQALVDPKLSTGLTTAVVLVQAAALEAAVPVLLVLVDPKPLASNITTHSSPL